MSKKTFLTKAEALAQVQALMAGTTKYFPSGSFTLGNVAYTTASLLQLFKSLEDAMLAADAAELAARDALTTKQGVEAKVDPVIRAYIRFVRAAFVDAAQPLADFGLEPPKVRVPRTSEQKAAAAAKARATRIARGTTSKKQKLAVKGDVTGITVTPITSPAPAAATSGAPAPTPQQQTSTPPSPAPAASASK